MSKVKALSTNIPSGYKTTPASPSPYYKPRLSRKEMLLRAMQMRPPIRNSKQGNKGNPNAKGRGAQKYPHASTQSVAVRIKVLNDERIKLYTKAIEEQVTVTTLLTRIVRDWIKNAA